MKKNKAITGSMAFKIGDNAIRIEGQHKVFDKMKKDCIYTVTDVKWLDVIGEMIAFGHEFTNSKGDPWYFKAKAFQVYQPLIEPKTIFYPGDIVQRINRDWKSSYATVKIGDVFKINKYIELDNGLEPEVELIKGSKLLVNNTGTPLTAKASNFKLIKRKESLPSISNTQQIINQILNQP
jgi:hypothetical protein